MILSWIEESWISNSQPRSHEFHTSIRKRRASFEHTKTLSKNIMERAQLEYQTLGKNVSYVLLAGQVRGKAFQVLVIVEPCSRGAYIIQSTLFTVPWDARFQKRESQIDHREALGCLHRAREGHMKESDKFYFVNGGDELVP